jgi:hypothetical protein
MSLSTDHYESNKPTSISTDPNESNKPTSISTDPNESNKPMSLPNDPNTPTVTYMSAATIHITTCIGHSCIRSLLSQKHNNSI